MLNGLKRFKPAIVSWWGRILAGTGYVVGGRARKSYMADFETTTLADDCRVWGWGHCDIDTAESVWDVNMGPDMDSFVAHVSKTSSLVYFHNLKFDGTFIIDWLFRNGYRHTQAQHARRGEFTTLISNMGAFYTISVTWENGNKTEFRDSFKKLPMSVSNVAKAFKLEETKGSVDYHATRPVGHVLTMAERGYIANDVLIPARALKSQFAEGMTKLTVGSDALTEFKQIMGKKKFERMFPVLPTTMDTEIRSAYRGGFTYADTRHQGRVTGSGRVYDVNSLYPSVMYNELLPYGEPIYAPGLPEPTEDYPLFLVSVTFTAKLKPGHIPCIQVKGSSRFVQTEYQTDIPDPVTIMTSNVDLALWQDHYDMEILSYNGGWLFKGVRGVFTEYIDKWMAVKQVSTGGKRAIAKLLLNALYGKFATNPVVTPKIPVMRDNVVKLVLADEETRDPVYTAMGVFITAYARDMTIRAAQLHYPVFAYADTDSLHLLTDTDPDTLDVDPNKLGAWKFEYAFDRAFFIRAKQYTEQLEDGTHVTHIAGMPEVIAEQLTIDALTGGTKKYDGKLVPRRVPGGVVLEDVGFTLNMG